MLYREMGKTGDKLSILGYGCMRFPKKDGKIDTERTEAQIRRAIEAGVNYFDTAYVYPHSEEVLGEILAKGLRDKVKLATKLPAFLIQSSKGMESTLLTSLKRLKTDHIDYYLIHNLNNFDGWLRMKELGVVDFLQKQREAGRIDRIGFSYHGQTAEFKKIIDDYDWDFCQIQYNYLDEHSQAGTEGLEYAGSKGLGVVIMEPLRGGLLATRLPKEAREVLEAGEGTRSPAERALRWLWNHPQVTTVLSGMNGEDQIEENLRTADAALPLSLTDEELAEISRAHDIIIAKMKVGCTGCSYCMPCPAGVNIPMCFTYYNNKYLSGSAAESRMLYLSMTIGKDGEKPSYASLCKSCGKCEQHCPQHLPIRQHLKEVAREMEGFYFRPLCGAIHGYYRVKNRFSRKSASSSENGR